jgi:tetratricopeptide (TPR) repeat protein
VGFALNHLAELYRTLGRYAEAEPLYLRFQQIIAQRAGPGHPHAARSWNNLGKLRIQQNRLDEAEPLLLQAVGLGEQTLGPDSFLMAVVSTTLENCIACVAT